MKAQHSFSHPAELVPEASVFVVANFVMACCWQVPQLPAPGQTLQATGLSMEPGGKGLNVAIGLHRLGLDVCALMACGRDAAGQQLKALFAQENLNGDAIIEVDGASGYGAGMIGANGQNAIAVFPGANLLLSAEHVNALREKIVASHLVYGQFETQIEAVAQAFDIARAHRICTVLNPSPWQTLNAKLAARLQASTQVLLLNETEAQSVLALAHPLPEDWAQCHALCAPAMHTLWQIWPALRLCVMTLGAQGCMVFSRGENQAHTAWSAHMPARKIAAIDTVGAGDAFANGFCAVLADHERRRPGQTLSDTGTLEMACQWGHWLGGHMASQAGVLHALAQLSALHRGLRRQTPARFTQIAQMS